LLLQKLLILEKNRKELKKRIVGPFNCIMNIVFFHSRPSIPKGAKAIQPFDKLKYLGKWYEIARLDFRYERGLNNTTAGYSLTGDGTIRVVNRGYQYSTGKWKQAVGKAKSAGDAQVAMLKVSFFGPLYAPYNVIALDAHYRYALVAGKSLKYLWILSREPFIPEEIKQQYLQLADSIGYDTSALIMVEHNLNQ